MVTFATVEEILPTAKILTVASTSRNERKKKKGTEMDRQILRKIEDKERNRETERRKGNYLSEACYP